MPSQLTKEKPASERQAQEIHNQNEQMKKTIQALKSELHEIHHEFNVSEGVALSLVSPARSDTSSFAEMNARNLWGVSMSLSKYVLLKHPKSVKGVLLRPANPPRSGTA
eukprot:11551171-Ditylum_brightwellii.AAC.1